MAPPSLLKCDSSSVVLRFCFTSSRSKFLSSFGWGGFLLFQSDPPPECCPAPRFFLFGTNFLAFEFSPVVGGVQDGQRSRYTKKMEEFDAMWPVDILFGYRIHTADDCEKVKLMSHVGSVER